MFNPFYKVPYVVEALCDRSTETVHLAYRSMHASCNSKVEIWWRRKLVMWERVPVISVLRELWLIIPLLCDYTPAEIIRR